MRPLTIQVVDDDEDFAESIADILDLEGYQTLLAHSGEEAIRQREREHVDLTLMDIRMPGLDGVETLRQFKAIDPHADVFMMTGFAIGAVREAAMSEGARGIMTKPVAAESLLDAVSAFNPELP